MECEIGHIVDTLKAGTKACLLIGAGCSVTAGIPDAGGFVQRIREKHPHKYERAKEKNYASCMATLHSRERRKLVADFVDEADINWAHICIAILIQKGYVERVLTTNFDPLVMRACALLSEFPAVYDFGASQMFDPANVSGQAVFHLHGQRTGFVMLHTEEKLEKQGKLVKPVFADAGQGRTWIVVGYSGENDPVFDNLAEVKEFDSGLYWIGYQKEDPGEHVFNKLLRVPDKGARIVRGYDADRFFIELTRKLECFPPDLVGRPFSHLERCLSKITDLPMSGESNQRDLLADARTKIDQAKTDHEKDGEPVALVNEYLAKGEFEKVLEFSDKIGEHPELTNLIAWAHIEIGNVNAKAARAESGDDAFRLFELARQTYEAALKIKPDSPVALYNLGNTLHEQAMMRTGQEADRFFELAGQKYEAALTIIPDKYEALWGWGLVLANQASTKTGVDADRLFGLAGDKYATALKIKPDSHEVLENWGIALSEWAKTKSGTAADDLFELAGQKHEAALVIKPDSHEALDNWGNTLIQWAKTKSGSRREELLHLAREKCLAAEEIPEGSGAYSLACIAAVGGDEDECHRWLEIARERGELEDLDDLKSDTDLDSMRDKQWFKDLMAEVEKEEKGKS